MDDFELIIEEVIRTRDDHRLSIFALAGKLIEFVRVAVFIARTMHEQHRFVTASQKSEVVLIDRRAQQKHGVDLRRVAGDSARNPRSK